VTRNARLVGLARSVIGTARDQQLSFLAAAIAYYAFISLVPLVLLALAVATLVGGPAFATHVVGVLEGALTPEASTLLEGALTSTAGRGGATVLGLVVLFWSSLRLFRGLDIAFSRVYGAVDSVSLLDQVTDALVVLAAMTLGVAVTVTVGTALPLALVPVAAAPLSLVVALSVVFLPLYYVFPDRPVTVREALPGAVAAAAGWTALGMAFGFYADRAGAFQLYGVIGGVLLLLAWFYLGGLVVLLGGAVNAALAGHDRQLQQGGPRDGKRPMSDADDGDTPTDTGGPATPGDGDGGNRHEGVATVEPETVDYEDFAELRRGLETVEAEIEDRTVVREELEADLRQYVRQQTRRGHARGWGPYLVLLYGTVMTLGAFYFLSGGWAVLAMLVVWLSTLGLYTLMVLVGVTTAAFGLPGRALDVLGKLRP